MLAAVNVALRQGSSTTAAASADPFSGEVFWTDGDRARVARRRRRRHGARPFRRFAAGRRQPRSAVPNAPGFRAVRLLADERFAACFRPRVVSTTLAVAWVAAGRRAAYVTDGDLRDSVHFASGIALCQAAGCVVTGIHGQPVHTGAGGLVAAADHATHGALLAMIGNQG